MAGVLEDLTAAGASAGQLVLPGSTFVHRRVQHVSYLDPSLTDVRLSVDFTPPANAGLYVPISVLPKWPPLYRFDYRRADGTPVPLLTSEENGAADYGLMKALVKEVSPNALASEPFNKALTSLTRGPETHLYEAFEVFRKGLGEIAGDPRRERVLELAAILADATFLWWPVDTASLGVRTICKIAYLIRSVEAATPLQRVRRSLSLYLPAEYIQLWHSGADANFHAEVEAPEGLTIRSPEPRFYRFAPEGPKAAGPPALRPEEFVDRAGRLAHVYFSGRRPLAADLVLTFAPTRPVIASLFTAAVLIAMLVTSFYVYRTEMNLSGHIEAAVAILILVPALIGYVVVRPSDPPMLRRYVFGTQLLSLMASAVPLVMAVLLLRYAADPDCLQTAWLWSMVGSWVIVGLLLASLVGAGDGKD
jgi:hypothetical protein